MSMKLHRTGLNRDSVFGYTCNQCILCCRFKTIQLNPYEVARLARNRQVTTTVFIEQYTGSGGTVLAANDDGTCVFLGSEGCDVHADRPLVCRLYPLGRRVSFTGDETFAQVACDEGCRGVFHEKGTVRQYLDEQGAFPFMDAADRYLALLRHLLENLMENESGPAESEAVRHVVNDVTGGAMEHDALVWNDMDRVLREHGRTKGAEIPESLEQRMIIHINAVRLWADDSRGGPAGGAQQNE